MNATPTRGGPKVPTRAKPTWARAAALSGLFGLMLAACTFDPDDRCGENQVIYGNNERCVCEAGTAWTPTGCVECGENEMPGAQGCVCTPGFQRRAEGMPCEAVPQGLGDACDTVSMPCADPEYNHCQVKTGTSGYCTKTDCAVMEDCELGYVCNTEASPSYCERPPTGFAKACTSDADCAGTEATYCDTFFSKSCLVRDCVVAPVDSCIFGWDCCDLTSVGLNMTLCVPDGSCTSG